MSSGGGKGGGPQGGQADGGGPAARPEDVDFDPLKIGARKLDPRGQIISQLEVEGPSTPGEFTAPKNAEFQRIVAEVSEEIDDQPITVEYKDIVRRFYGALGKGARGTAVRRRTSDSGATPVRSGADSGGRDARRRVCRSRVDRVGLRRRER